jgi:hypothetical protein
MYVTLNLITFTSKASGIFVVDFQEFRGNLIHTEFFKDRN